MCFEAKISTASATLVTSFWLHFQCRQTSGIGGSVDAIAPVWSHPITPRNPAEKPHQT